MIYLQIDCCNFCRMHSLLSCTEEMEQPRGNQFKKKRCNIIQFTFIREFICLWGWGKNGTHQNRGNSNDPVTSREITLIKVVLVFSNNRKVPLRPFADLNSMKVKSLGSHQVRNQGCTYTILSFQDSIFYIFAFNHMQQP